MRKSLWSILLGGLILAWLAGCGGPAPQPLTFTPPPWGDGEVSTYDVLGQDGKVIGQASWTWRRSGDGWVQSYELTLGSRRDRGEVVVGPDLAPVSSWRELAGQRFETTYTADAVSIKGVGADGSVSIRGFGRPAEALDNDQTLQVQRALPLAKGYATRYTNVIPTTAVQAPTRVTVSGPETVTVSAGTFSAWHAVMESGGSRHDAWYGQDAPHLLIKYRNRAAGSEFQLRSWQVSAGAAIQGSPAAPETLAQPGREGPPPLNVPFLAVAVLLQYPLMLIFPLLLGWWIRRRFGIGWGVFWAGALTFVASQVVHLPLNWALGLLGGGRGVALWPLVPMALVAGLSSGISEEGTRWIALRFFMKRTRGWREALQFGAGHGGIEALILGALALLSLITMLALRSLNAESIGLPGMTAEQAWDAVAAYWSSPWYMPLLAGLERVFAITTHIAMAVLVMRSVTRGQVGYFLAAIGLHTVMNFWAVWAARQVSAVGVEFGLGAVALFALWLIVRLRAEPAEKVPALAPTADDPATGPGQTLAPRALSPEELARRADASRYE